MECQVLLYMYNVQMKNNISRHDLIVNALIVLPVATQVLHLCSLTTNNTLL